MPFLESEKTRSFVRKDAQQRVTPTFSLERTAYNNRESSSTHYCFNISL
jgi:hypothetical protein